MTRPLDHTKTVPELQVERCQYCLKDVSAVTKRALRAALAEHAAYHHAQKLAGDRVERP